MVYDVAVIGAGPAGSTTARFCAMRGLKTLLLDRCSFPRKKVCGGGITTAALNSLGFPLPVHIVLGQVCNLYSVFDHKSVYFSHPRPFMVTVDRAVFDDYLAEKAIEAGVEFKQTENLTSLTREGSNFSLKTQNGAYMTKSLIGADGVNSTTARLTGLTGQSENNALCLTAEVPAKSDNSQREAVQIHYNLVPKGYGWIFPKGDRLTLGVGCFASNYGILRRALDKLAASASLDLPNTVKGHYIPYGKRTPECVNDGIILAGDAAGFVDPFTGEGIRFAIISGMLAGETIWNCYRNSQPTNKKNLAVYMEKCRQAFLRDFKYSFLLAKAFFAFPSVMHRFLSDNKEIYGRLLNILEGRYTFRKLVKDVASELPKYCFSKLPKYPFNKIGQIRE